VPDIDNEWYWKVNEKEPPETEFPVSSPDVSAWKIDDKDRNADAEDG